MKKLTEKEVKFINALKEDFNINGDKSFIEILFQASFEKYEKQRDDSNKNDIIFEDLKKQKEDIQKCINDPCRVIDSFILNNIKKVEDSMNYKLKIIQEEKSLKDLKT